MTIKPAVAHAGLFTFLERIFTQSITNDQQPSNLQANVVSSADHFLKSAPANAPEGVLLTDLTFADDSALLASIGPLGNIADAQEIKSARISTYTVREGDTLSDIAAAFHISVATLIWANDIQRADTIRAGQVLVILPITGVQYTVKRGDTIGGVIKQFGGDREEIIRINRLPIDGTLTAGETILIPNGELRLAQNTTPPKTSQRTYSDYYMRPIVGGVKTQSIHGFNGVDLANSCGSAVRASAPGTVIIARGSGWNGGYGHYIVIDHPNNTQTLYAHLGNLYIAAGTYAAQGQTIGTMGTSGLSTGCHLHFEIRGAKNPF
jgi:murein DD-endopeptidase MepM/ murein hydrolase activator NlpD